ncbi:MAG: 3-hydroxyacyl-[acyl-carrier-protein] dehydratase, FabZ form [Devosia sp.]|nr:3-hydroxyacyl-[acyl-carrier-protein] dehydratase, FabZ form [Devosia sp.]
MDEKLSEVQAEMTSLDITRILECLPHRYPFLMIDRIINIRGDDSAVGIKNVTFNEPMFQGHFPGKPIFPGVLIIEGMAQTAGAVVVAHDAGGGKKNLVLMLTIDKAKFRKPAEPGDQIEYHMRKIQRRRTVGRYEGRAIVNGVVIAEAEIGAMIVEA